MQVNLQSAWWPRLISFLLAGLAAGSAAFWFLLQPGQDGTAAAPLALEMSPVAEQDLSRLLGRPESGPVSEQVVATSGRFILTGVLASSGQSGAALISVDGKTAKSYKPGDWVADSLYLQSVSRRSVVLADRGDKAATGLVLEMKPLTR